MSIEKRNDGYCVRWRDSSGRARSKQVRLWRDATALDGEMKRKKAMGELITHERGTIRLDDFWELYWRNHAEVHTTERTRDNYARLWRKHIQPEFGASRLRVIDREMVAAFVSKLSKKGLAPVSVRMIVAVFKSAMQKAVEWGYISMNPAAGVRQPKLVKQRESIALQQDQVEALRAELDLRSSTVVAMLAGAGVRPGELRALRWRDVRDSGAIIVEFGASRNNLGPTKTNSKRAVTMLEPYLRPALAAWRLASAHTGPNDLVFPAVNGSTVWTDNGWRLWQRGTFARAADRAGLQGLVPYDLRHTWVSHRIAERADIYRVAREAGHSVQLCLGTYAHLINKLVYSECIPLSLAPESLEPTPGFEPGTPSLRG